MNRKILLSLLCVVFFSCATVSKYAKEESYNYSLKDSDVNIVLNVKENKALVKELLKNIDFSDNSISLLFNLLTDANISILTDGKTKFVCYLIGAFPTKIMQYKFKNDKGFEKISDTKFLMKKENIYLDFIKPYLLVVSNILDYDKYDTTNFYPSFSIENTFTSIRISDLGFLSDLGSIVKLPLSNLTFKLDLVKDNKYDLIGQIEFKDSRSARLMTTLLKLALNTYLIKNLGSDGRSIGNNIVFTVENNIVKLSSIVLTKTQFQKVFGPQLSNLKF